MTNTRTTVFRVALAILFATSGSAGAQKLNRSSHSATLPVLSLNFANNGQHLPFSL
jgi:hypothetical protein